MGAAPRTEIPNAPANWIDWVVVQRLVAGKDPGPRWPTRAERRAATTELLGQGATHTRITKTLRVSGGYVSALARSIQADLADAETAALRADVGAVRAFLDINVQWLTEPLGRDCDCGYIHYSPATCEVSYWEPDPINPRDGSHHQEVLARCCVPAATREAAKYSDTVTIELGLCLRTLAARAARVAPQLDEVAA